MQVELGSEDLEEIAAEVSSWRPDKIIELVKLIDQHASDWSIVLGLKEWVDGEAVTYAREIADDKRDAGECYMDPDTQKIVHQDPHKSCILR